MNIKQIKQILDNAPNGATHFDSFQYPYTYWSFDPSMSQSWRHWDGEKWSGTAKVRLTTTELMPLYNQLALHEENEKLKDALNAAVRACYDVDTNSVREENSDYIKACEILDSIEGLSNDN